MRTHLLIKKIWKTLVANKSQNEDHKNDEMTFDNFKLLFEFSKLLSILSISNNFLT